MRQLCKHSLLRLANNRVAERLARVAAERAIGGNHLLTVLTYHRIGEPCAVDEFYPGLISATPEQFARQMQTLRSVASIVSMDQVLRLLRGEGRLPPKALLLTFDDATPDFAQYGWPILKSLQLPATLFVPTAYPGCGERSFWWDRLYRLIWQGGSEPLPTPWGPMKRSSTRSRQRTYRELRDRIFRSDHDQALDWIAQWEAVHDGRAEGVTGRSGVVSVLDWDALRQLRAEGVTIAPHTRTHPLLNRVPPERVEAEIRGSIADLRREIGRFAPVFAYPGGATSSTARRAVESAGLEAAFTTERGTNDLRTADRYQLRRINVGGRTPGSLLLGQLALHWRGSQKGVRPR